MAVAKTVDEYLAVVSEPARSSLEKLRRDIRAAAPGSVELISYQLPTFKYEGKHLVAFGAWKKHCSLYIMSTAVAEAHEDDLKAYDTAKGTVHFPPERPLPARLVRKLVRARIEENANAVRKNAEASGRRRMKKAPAR